MIKQIFDEITAVGGDKAKMEILSKYKDNELLKRVLYLCKSKRVKFYIKQIPEYTTLTSDFISLEDAIDKLSNISNRYVTGNEALNFLQEILSNLEPDDAYIIERIIDKDLKIGMGTTFINKVFKDLIEDTPYMGAVSFDEKKARKIFDKGGKGLSQIKMDGRYANAIIRNGEVELESRQGEPTILTGAKFLEELTKFEDCVLNGELTMDGVPRYESNGIIASLIDICGKKASRSEAETNRKIVNFEDKHGSFAGALERIRYTVWDALSIDEYFAKASKTPYYDRLDFVASYIMNAEATMIKPIESKEVETYGEAMEHFQEVLSTEVDGVPQEGTILKAYDGVWKDGKPSHQIKMKLEMDVDLRITGFNMGTKGTKNEFVVSSFNVESSDGLVKTRPQGLKEDMMKFITENQDNLLGKVIQVKCNGLSNDKDGNYSLLYPSFIAVRDDKDTCDSLESIKEIENMIKLLAK
jgi:hypothetical protein